MKENKIKVELELSRCENELKAKTEEVEKLKIEIKDINQIVDLEERLKESTDDKDFETVNERPRNKPTGKSKVKKGIQEEVEYNCSDCFFQGTSNGELLKHIDIKHNAHKVPVPNLNGSVKCRNCGEIFETKSNLMVHRKNEHLSTVAYCRNYANKTCPFSNKMCWWSHAENTDNGEENIKCFICEKYI